MKALYFAYGLNLEEHTMVDQYPSARFYKFAQLKGFRLIFSGKGLCSIDVDPGFVEGVLYEVNHWELEEAQEGSTRSTMDVLCDNGQYVTAIVYYTHEKSLVAPQEDYLMRVHKKYQDYGFNTKAIENALDKLTYR